MTQYLVSFNEGTMVIPEQDLPEVVRDSMAVVHEATAAGAFVFGGGLLASSLTSVVARDGTITQGPNPACKDFIGGFCIIEARDQEEALRWAAKFAKACRCAQDVRAFMPRPDEAAR